MPEDKRQLSGKARESEARSDRLSRALRDNLKRRKAATANEVPEKKKT